MAKWKPPVNEPKPARPYVAVSFSDMDLYFKARKDLEDVFGKADFETPAIRSANLRSLYGKTAPEQIRFVSFQRPVGREELVDIRRKLLTIETKRQDNGRPLVELDPGYVADYTVVRTSLEEDFHRVYLYSGIWAETLFYFERMTFRPYSHTPDLYRESDVVTVMNDLRIIYSNQK
ncbi:MAG: DUF4416 family protein [Spirochaetia bacterium]|nr:DUF4416 family protein [Spirochaetia bacterium]